MISPANKRELLSKRSEEKQETRYKFYSCFFYEHICSAKYQIFLTSLTDWKQNLFFWLISTLKMPKKWRKFYQR